MDLDLILRGTLSIAVVFIVPLLLVILKKHVNALHNDELKRTVEIFVKAAEQMLKEEDPTGEKRKQFVIDKLTEMGIKHSALIDALIEACVHELNN